MNQVKHKAFDFSVRGEVLYQESMRRHTIWHAGGYAVNLGTATAANIENLIDQVQSVVKHQQGIEMEREIQIVGERA